MTDSKARRPNGTFAQGVSGNPLGRPRNASLKDAILADLERVEGLTGRRRLELLAERLGDAALGGDPVALRLVVDRLWPARLELNQSGVTTVQLIDLSDERKEELAPGAIEPRIVDAGPPVLDMRVEPTPERVAPVASMPAPEPVFLLRRQAFEDFQDEADR